MEKERLMTTETLNTGLIEEIRNRLPQGENIANTLMDMLFIGKEAVYRRLRGEVPFTFYEVAVISKKLGLSLDRLITHKNKDSASFNLNFVGYKHPMEVFQTILDSYINAFNLFKFNSDSELGTSSNDIPLALFLNYKQLSQFSFFRWFYQHETSSQYKHFEEIEFSESLYKKQQEFVLQTQLMPKATYILNQGMFFDFVNDIKYFSDIQLINPESVREIKNELLELLHDLELMTIRGTFSSGTKVNFYISNINFDSTYSYLETYNHKYSLIRIFEVNSVTTFDPEVFTLIKGWIQSLKRFSTLISKSGEMQRIQFFNKQRELINKI